MEGLRTTRKSVRTVGDLAKIRTEYIPNKSIECYYYITNRYSERLTTTTANTGRVKYKTRQNPS
jgi:hypothetical protein